MDTIDWFYIFLYFTLQKWKCRQEVWIGGSLQRLPNSDESVRWGDLCRETESILARQTERDGHHHSSETSNYAENQFGVFGSADNVAKERGENRRPGTSKFETIVQKVSSLLSEFSCIPLTEIRNIIPEHHPRFELSLCNPVNDKYFQSACALYQMKINKMNLIDFRNIYEQGKPIFYANNLDPFVYYHSRADSAQFLIDLLRYQYSDDFDRIRELLSNIVSWFNRKGWNILKDGKYVLNPKINCVCINGPPNSGKNYFWDTIAAIATNVGHIGRVSNKCNQFSLQDAYNRRLVMGNELSMEDSAKEDFKKLCEGAAFNIRVKFQGDKIFTRTPVCFITNGTLELSGDPHFKNVRLVSFRWNTCHLLAKSDKKPYPVALFDVFDFFNVSLE